MCVRKKRQKELARTRKRNVNISVLYMKDEFMKSLVALISVLGFFVSADFAFANPVGIQSVKPCRMALPKGGAFLREEASSSSQSLFAAIYKIDEKNEFLESFVSNPVARARFRSNFDAMPIHTIWISNPTHACVWTFHLSNIPPAVPRNGEKWPVSPSLLPISKYSNY